MRLFLRKPGLVEGLPPANKFNPSDLDGFPVADSNFSASTEKLDPKSLDEMVAKYGPNVFFPHFGKSVLLATSPSLVTEILVHKPDSFLKGDEERALARVVGWGLIAQEGDDHRKTQRALAPGMRGHILDHFVKRISRSFGAVLAQGTKSHLNLIEFSREVAQNGAETSIFGLDEPSQFYDYHRSVLVVNRFTMWEATPGRDHRESRSEFFQALKTVRSHVEHLMELSRNTQLDEPSLMHYINSAAENQPEGLPGAVDQAGMFLQAATETTASLLSWLLLHLSHHPEIWRELHNEAQNVGSDLPSHAELKELTLHQAVIKETLRLSPPVWMFSRVAKEGVSLGGSSLPMGTRVMLSPWVTQRSSGSYRDPLVFRPSRWIDTSESVAQGAFIPFGMGKRVCIGESYGKAAVAAMLLVLSRNGLTPTVNPPDLEDSTSYLIRNPSSKLTVEFG